MTSTKKQFLQLSQRIVINLAKQQELLQKASKLESEAAELGDKVTQLTREVKLLSEENADLKEIVYELHYENQRLQKLTTAQPGHEPGA